MSAAGLGFGVAQLSHTEALHPEQSGSSCSITSKAAAGFQLPSAGLLRFRESQAE